MANWFMITLVGEDQPNIVAPVSQALFEGNCQLGETSMMRLGGNFTIMMMVSHTGSNADLEALIEPVATKLKLRAHVDAIAYHVARAQASAAAAGNEVPAGVVL